MMASFRVPRLVLAVLIATSASTHADEVSPSAAAGSLPSASSCKPLAPLDIGFEVLDVDGEFVDVGFTIDPRAPLRDLRWELDLHGTVTLVEGAPAGRVDDTAAVRRATLRVPADGTHKLAELVVRGTRDGSGPDGERFDEPVAAARVLEWERPEVAAPVRVPARWTPAPDRARSTHVASSGDDSPDGAFLVTGTFQYEDKAWGWMGWTGVDPLLPIRRADVTVLDALSGEVLGQGSTGQDGSFAVGCAVGPPTELLVLCESDTGFDTDFQRIRVTPFGAIDYVLEGPVLVHDGASDVDIGTVTALKTVIGGKDGNPFNIFDVTVGAWEWLLGPGVEAGFTPPTVGIEPVRNVWPNGPKTFAQPWGGWIADGDAYDDAVILHELGHVAQYQYTSPPMGGTHTFGDSDLDPRLALSEGFATCFAGMVFADMGLRPIYVDCHGSSQLGGWSLRLDMETMTPYAADARGSADEVAVCCALYDLLDDTATPDTSPGFDDDAFDGSLLVGGVAPTLAFWELFTGAMTQSTWQAFFMTHNDTWDAWVAVYGPGGPTDTVRELFEGFGQDFFEDAYEPNDGPAQATPLPLEPAGGAWAGPFTLYREPPGATAPGIDDEDWFAHELVQGSIVTFATRYPNGAADADTQADTLLELYAPDGTLVAWDDDSGKGRNAKISDFTVTETGVWQTRVLVELDGWPLPTEWFIRRYGKYEYRARAEFENHAPVVTIEPAARPATVPSGGRTRLHVEASDVDAGQELEYIWRPLDGGSILGGGPVVTFVAPATLEALTVRVQLVVRDELGAESRARVVPIRVGS